jgi:hypothetical protein
MAINWAKTNGRIQHGFIKLHRAKNNVKGRSWKHMKEDFEVNYPTRKTKKRVRV